MLQAQEKFALEQAAPVGPQLYRRLRECIIQGELAPGSRISESELARDFAVSRQPVREAFIKLSEEGLLEVRPQRGTFVRKIAKNAVMDSRFVREAIEADIVKLLAAAPDKGLIRNLRGQLAEQRRAAGRDAARFMELDELFHRTLAEAAGKSFAWNVIEGVKAQMDRVRHLSLFHFPMEKLVEQHTDIVDAIAAGETKVAESAMRAHLREILNDLPHIAASRPEFFDNPA